MDFDPRSRTIQACLEGMRLEAGGAKDEAGRCFQSAWDQAVHDFERFYAAYFVSRCRPEVRQRLEWLRTAVTIAQEGGNEVLKAACPALHLSMADCQEKLGDREAASRERAQAEAARSSRPDRGPFYHGTKAALRIGEQLTAGVESNYQAGLRMRHVYFTALVHGAGLAAALARGEGPGRVYAVEATGPFEADPNVTDKKFPGNPTRSYRSESPLAVVGELEGWERLTPEELRHWRAKLDANKGEIID